MCVLYELPHRRASRVIAVALVLLAGCPVDDDDDDSVEEDPWVAEQTDLPGAALSIWGMNSSDVWVAGTGGDTGEPMLLHRTGGDWEQLDTGATGEGWWVVGDGDDVIWLVGEAGLVLRYDRVEDTFTPIETDTPATLFGAWVAPSGALYAVGGVVGSDVEGPVLLRVEGDVATEIELPNGVTADENLFKVWGAADDDIWVISDMGTVLHWNGAVWSRQVLPDNPRLITVHGSGADDLVVVGGLSQAVLFERRGVAWEDVPTPGGQPLNGVFVTADGGGFAAGFGNFMMEREDGVWSRADASPTINAHWHGAWVDETGSPWVVGGNLTALIDGVVARREAP